MIRVARPDELAGLVEIERAAGEVFRGIGMAAIADDDPGSVAGLSPYQEAGRCWVWADADDRAVAYLIAEWVDGNVHVEQVSVHPAHTGHRHGRRLIEHVAAQTGAPALTLTTFTEVAWNAPYYERCGFRRLADDELTPGLRAIRAAEAARGLDRWPRAAMRRDR